MKKLTLALAAAMALSSAAYAQSSSATGTIDFSGEVTTAACSVTSDTINLFSHTTRELGADGSGKWGTGNIHFYGCDLDPASSGANTITSVSVEVSPGSASEDSKVWKNLGTAKNVGVEIEMQGQPILPAGNVGTGIVAQLTDAGAKIEVAGRTTKVNGTDATPGTVNAKVNFVATFK
ncbi:MAG TPA: fimbrial protein [Candidatus Ignatzschineria merdigallinarum]|uniref:Fimbrial protein n=1 Tax=Candidatus Ignatzschineria merdigallinarum TaxID=2838621 RepID=A0A9D1TTD0_9GAMM|nr:fimbrial protein [Candidatus Ignatzschineria merdigallinarum]